MRLRHRKIKRRASLYNPSKINGLVLWLQSDSSYFNLSGSSIVSWKDISGLGNDFVQPIAAKRPTATFHDSLFGDRPVARFDGVNDCMSGTVQFGDYTAFMVCFISSSNNFFFNRQDTTHYDYAYTGNDNTGNFYDGINPPSGPSGGAIVASLTKINVLNSQFVRSSTSGLSWGTSVVPHTYAFISTNKAASASCAIRQDGQSLLIHQTLSFTGFTSDVLNIPLNLFSNNQTMFASGSLAEVVIYNRVLNSTEITRVETYLRNRFKHY